MYSLPADQQELRCPVVTISEQLGRSSREVGYALSRPTSRFS
jgi:hypothetical protein